VPGLSRRAQAGFQPLRARSLKGVVESIQPSSAGVAYGDVVVSSKPEGGRRRPTATTSFGSSRRESHDATAFYDRFVPPEVSDDTDVTRAAVVDVIYHQDARWMTEVADRCVALVVTSPPYFAGKEYEQTLGRDGVPADYFEYLGLLRGVFVECKRVLEPGGRLAVNVANLGRRPYRSLAGDVASILQDLGLLLRGEVVWWKGRAAGGSCAWGSFQSPRNPVLRDITERIVIASKGRFDRAIDPAGRGIAGLPSRATISRDEFLAATTDLWELAPESAHRVGHPAPFPVELPQRLIELYTYEGDVVLDPFAGSGSTAVAAVRSGRHYIGFDTDAGYVAAARQRVGAALRAESTEGEGPVADAVGAGQQAKEVAAVVLETCGFTALRRDVKVPGIGIEIALVAVDRTGREWRFDVAGSFVTGDGGLTRSDELWSTIGRAAVLHGEVPYVVLTTRCPTPASPGGRAIAAVRGPGQPVYDVIALRDQGDRNRLAGYAQKGP
jgi:DNA modification methylase